MIVLAPALLLLSSVPARICSAVPKAEIEAAVGLRLGPAEQEYTRFESTCTWSSGEAEVTISIHQLSEPLDLAAELSNLKAAFPGSKLTEVAVPEARAFALEIPGIGAQLHILRTEREYLLISIAGLENPDRALQAATKIARRL